MKAGDPFDTPGLDEVRAEQRRALRLVPTYIFAEYAPTIGPDVTNIADVDRPLIETALRAEAKPLLGQLSSLLDEWHHHAHTEIIDHFYAQNRSRAEQMDAARQTAFADELETARQAHRATVRSTPRIEDAAALRRLLFLLVWADGLTDYRDLRTPLAPDAERLRPLSDEGALTSPGVIADRVPAPADDDATDRLAPPGRV